jgi:hypothetical protein
VRFGLKLVIDWTALSPAQLGFNSQHIPKSVCVQAYAEILHCASVTPPAQIWVISAHVIRL